jgi:hypothetical protein
MPELITVTSEATIARAIVATFAPLEYPASLFEHSLDSHGYALRVTCSARDRIEQDDRRCRSTREVIEGPVHFLFPDRKGLDTSEKGIHDASPDSFVRHARNRNPQLHHIRQKLMA